MELQEEINNISKNYICTFNNTLVKFAVYIVKSCGPMLVLQEVNNFLETFFFSKKSINVDLDKVPRKSLAATVLVEKEALSQMQFFEEIKKDDQNILHKK